MYYVKIFVYKSNLLLDLRENLFFVRYIVDVFLFIWIIILYLINNKVLS